MKKNKSEFKSFTSAIYCFEELLMLDSSKFEIYVKLAELHFTIGRLEHFILARKYFSFVLTINSIAMRPLMGLLRTCEMLKSYEKDEMNQKIIDIIHVKLKNIYKQSDIASSVKNIF